MANFGYLRIYCNMEILILVLLYYLSQNPDFADSVKPLMGQIKDSEEMLRFVNDLSKFTQTFAAFTGEGADGKGNPGKDCKQGKPQPDPPSAPPKGEKKENPQSPTAGIADEFIQNILDSYLKKH